MKWLVDFQTMFSYYSTLVKNLHLHLLIISENVSYKSVFSSHYVQHLSQKICWTYLMKIWYAEFPSGAGWCVSNNYFYHGHCLLTFYLFVFGSFLESCSLTETKRIPPQHSRVNCSHSFCWSSLQCRDCRGAVHRWMSWNVVVVYGHLVKIRRSSRKQLVPCFYSDQLFTGSACHYGTQYERISWSISYCNRHRCIGAAALHKLTADWLFCKVPILQPVVASNKTEVSRLIAVLQRLTADSTALCHSLYLMILQAGTAGMLDTLCAASSQLILRCKTAVSTADQLSQHVLLIDHDSSIAASISCSLR